MRHASRSNSVKTLRKRIVESQEQVARDQHRVAEKTQRIVELSAATQRRTDADLDGRVARLQKLKSEIDPFLRQRRGSFANYEDIAYVLGQIAD